MINENVKKVLFKIEAAAKHSGINAAKIKLICASKYVDSTIIREAFEAGIRIFGENKVQDARQKIEQLKGLAIEWHMIGHLQTNKAKFAVSLFNLIHTVDGLHLAGELNSQAQKIGKIQDILIEVKTTEEEQKYGVKPREALDLVKAIVSLKNLRLKGLMTMGKLSENPEDNRIYFKQLKGLFEETNVYLRTIGYESLTELSMGMTGDFEIAIEEGATMARIGRAIWGIL